MKVINFSRAYRVYTLSDGIRISLLNGSALIWNDKADKGILACCHNDGTRKACDEETCTYKVITLADALKMMKE